MIQIALIGYGKMGKAIENIIEEEYADKVQVLYKIDENNSTLLAPQYLSKVDVAIEFTTPHTAVSHIMKCFEADVPIVVGSTGWYHAFDEVQKRCLEGKHSLFYATNFSIGVNIFFQVNQYLSKILSRYPEYFPKITEIHHTEKKDAPSGTAITLAEDILKHHKHFNSWANYGEVLPHQLPIISERKEGVPGTHRINYVSDIDTISIEHIAHSRKGFAQGAVEAALFLHSKKGIFQMNDLLQF